MSVDLKIKVCGIQDQACELDELGVDYIGHIIWEGSRRYLTEETAQLFKEQQLNAKRVGVFVDQTINEIKSRCEKYALDVVQLHGAETPDFCATLRSRFDGAVWKAFTIDENFDFESTQLFDSVIDCCVFDTRGKLPGGNGTTFNWSLLEAYKGSTNYLLSGGIGPDSIADIKAFMQTSYAKKCVGIDLNSKFEIRPGEKDLVKLANFITQIKAL
jgi:phosphoribosylanthranilate isomerase